MLANYPWKTAEAEIDSCRHSKPVTFPIRHCDPLRCVTSIPKSSYRVDIDFCIEVKYRIRPESRDRKVTVLIISTHVSRVIYMYNWRKSIDYK